MLETQHLEVTERNQELSVTLKEFEKGTKSDNSEEISILKTRINELIAKNRESEKRIYELSFIKQQASNEYNEQEDRERKARERHVLMAKNNHGSESYYGYEQYHEQEYYPARYSHPGRTNLALFESTNLSCREDWGRRTTKCGITRSRKKPVSLHWKASGSFSLAS